MVLGVMLGTRALWAGRTMPRQDNAQVEQCHQGAGKKRDVWKCLPVVIGEWQDGAGEESMHGWNIKGWL